jgi:hypothetical protein
LKKLESINIIINDTKRDIFMSYECHFRTCEEFAQFARYMDKHLNPYSMKYLYEEDGEMNGMVWMSIIPLVGTIVFILRVPLVLIWLTCGFCHTLCRQRIDRPAYFKIFGLYVLTGFLAGSVVLTWVNWIIYKKRYAIIPMKERVRKTILPVHNPAVAEQNMDAVNNPTDGAYRYYE